MIIELMEVLIIFHTSGFRIITGYRAWKYFCNFSNIYPNELIDFIRYLVRDIY